MGLHGKVSGAPLRWNVWSRITSATLSRCPGAIWSIGTTCAGSVVADAARTVSPAVPAENAGERQQARDPGRHGSSDHLGIHGELHSVVAKGRSTPRPRGLLPPADALACPPIGSVKPARLITEFEPKRAGFDVGGNVANVGKQAESRGLRRVGKRIKRDRSMSAAGAANLNDLARIRDRIMIAASSGTGRAGTTGVDFTFARRQPNHVSASTDLALHCGRCCCGGGRDRRAVGVEGPAGAGPGPRNGGGGVQRVDADRGARAVPPRGRRAGPGRPLPAVDGRARGRRRSR